MKRAPKFTSEYVDQLERTAFYSGHLVPRWPRKKTGGRPVAFKNTLPFKQLFGILRDIVPDAENTAVRRAIARHAPIDHVAPGHINVILLNFILKFKAESIAAPAEMCDGIRAACKERGVTVTSLDSLRDKCDLVVVAHQEPEQYIKHARHIICYYFDTTPDVLATYRALYVQICGKNPVFMNVPRDTLREKLTKLKYRAETDETPNVSNTLGAYAMCYSAPIGAQ
jgi:hypothetical protein